MEILVLLGALVTLDVLALWKGADSRDTALSHHERAMDAIRAGDTALYQAELKRSEEELGKRALY